MEFTNGYWGTQAAKRGTSMFSTARTINVGRRTLYHFLGGRLECVGPSKRRALCRHWRIKWRELEKLIRHRARLTAQGKRR